VVVVDRTGAGTVLLDPVTGRAASTLDVLSSPPPPKVVIPRTTAALVVTPRSPDQQAPLVASRAFHRHLTLLTCALADRTDADGEDSVDRRANWS
jgi:hypothetical protein